MLTIKRLTHTHTQIEIRTWCSIRVLLLECRETLVICICFDILISFSVGYISTQWKALFKSVFNIVVLNLCIYRSCTIQIVLVDMLLLSFYYKRTSHE